MDIALVNCPSWSINTPPLGIPLLSAFLKKEGHKVFIFDLNIAFYHKCQDYQHTWRWNPDSHWKKKIFVEDFVRTNGELIDKFVDDILSTGAKIIGFRVTVPNRLMSLELAKMIKKKDKNRIIIFGGPDCSKELKEVAMSFIKEEFIDFVVIGEADLILPEIVERLGCDGKINFCPGTLLKRNGEVIDCGDGPIITDLDILPFPDLTDFNLELYESCSKFRMFEINASRGCLWRCVFCQEWQFWKNYRSMSGERIFSEVEHQINLHKNLEGFYLNDLLFNGNIKSLSRFCELMIERNARTKIRINWVGDAIIRPEMTYELLTKMQKAGCDQIAYGLESGSQSVIDKMGKRFKIEAAERVIQDTHRAGIKAFVNVICGFPTEEREDFQQTINFIKRNANFIDQLRVGGVFTVAPFVYLHDHLEEFNISPDDEDSVSDVWETQDGRNNYIERLDRLETISQLAKSLNIELKSCYDDIDDIRKLKNIYLIKYAKKDKKDNVQISFKWNIHYACNYHCPYCRFDGKWQELLKRNQYLSTQELLRIWSNIYKKYGSVYIEITGGEPFIYPNFIELIRELCDIHAIEIATNLSLDLDNFIEVIDRHKVKITANFHPLFADIESFLRKTLLLKESGFKIGVCYLAYPPQMKQMVGFRRRFEEAGINFALAAFWGEYQGRRYPESYTEEEREFIRPFLGDIDRIVYHLNANSPKGKLCNAGYKYAVVQADGNVVRCGQLADKFIGNIMDENFHLFEKPLPCEAESCPCNEYVNLIDGKIDNTQINKVFTKK